MTRLLWVWVVAVTVGSSCATMAALARGRVCVEADQSGALRVETQAAVELQRDGGAP